MFTIIVGAGHLLVKFLLTIIDHNQQLMAILSWSIDRWDARWRVWSMKKRHGWSVTVSRPMWCSTCSFCRWSWPQCASTGGHVNINGAEGFVQHDALLLCFRHPLLDAGVYGKLPLGRSHSHFWHLWQLHVRHKFACFLENSFMLMVSKCFRGPPLWCTGCTPSLSCSLPLACGCLEYVGIQGALLSPSRQF